MLGPIYPVQAATGFFLGSPDECAWNFYDHVLVVNSPAKVPPFIPPAPQDSPGFFHVWVRVGELRELMSSDSTLHEGQWPADLIVPWSTACHP